MTMDGARRKARTRFCVQLRQMEQNFPGAFASEFLVTIVKRKACASIFRCLLFSVIGGIPTQGKSANYFL